LEEDEEMDLHLMVKELHVDEVIRNNAFAVYLTEEGDGESRI